MSFFLLLFYKMLWHSKQATYRLTAYLTQPACLQTARPTQTPIDIKVVALTSISQQDPQFQVPDAECREPLLKGKAQYN